MTDDPLAAGPAMDAALCELMGVEPEEWKVQDQEDPGHHATFDTREAAEWWSKEKATGFEIVPVFPAYSTTDDGMGLVLDWLEKQGWKFQAVRRSIFPLTDEMFDCVLCGNGREVCALGSTRAEAVGRAALKTKEQE